MATLNRYSARITQDRSQVGSQAMLYGTGMTEEDMDRPQVGIASVWYDGNTCNMHLMDLATKAREGVTAAGMVGMRFNTIGVSDGISMGTEGMSYSLQSRDIIADSIETMMAAQWYDANISIPGCDKNMPGCLMAIGRLNRPSMMVYGGTIRPGHCDGRKLDIVSSFESYGEFLAGKMDETDLTNRIGNKMIRPTTVPQSLEALIIEQAIAREALRLSFEQHKEFAVHLKGVQTKRTISDAFEQTSSGETLVNLMELDMLVGSGGVLSHAPRRHQAARMLIDAFLPEGITQLAVDSIFMMPQLGILSTIHPEAAVEVFEKDCLIRLGTCIAPVGKTKQDQPVLQYEINLQNERIGGELMPGELILIPAPYEPMTAHLTPGKGLDIGAGKNEPLDAKICGGVVGIILDGRGRQPFNLHDETESRVQDLTRWSENTSEYPKQETAHV